MSLGRALLLLQRLDAQLPRPTRHGREYDEAAHPWGITQREFSMWTVRQGLQGLPLDAITREQALAFLHDSYWLPAHCHVLPWPLAVSQLACALHTGVPSALRVLRRAHLLLDMGPTLAPRVTSECALSAKELAQLNAWPVNAILEAQMEARREWLAEIAERDASQRGAFEHWLASIYRLAHVLIDGGDVGRFPPCEDSSGLALLVALT